MAELTVHFGYAQRCVIRYVGHTLWSGGIDAAAVYEVTHQVTPNVVILTPARRLITNDFTFCNNTISIVRKNLCDVSIRNNLQITMNYLPISP